MGLIMRLQTEERDIGLVKYVPFSDVSVLHSLKMMMIMILADGNLAVNHDDDGNIRLVKYVPFSDVSVLHSLRMR